MKLKSIIAIVVFTLVTTTLPITFVGEKSAMNTLTQDQAEIAGIVESVGVMADRGEYNALARLYADEFTLDYSSLNGQDAATKTPAQLMAEWAAVLPGFDLTRHDVSNVAVNVDGEIAEAKADVVASHWVGDLFWQVAGSYDYELVKKGSRWQITSMSFNLENESGTRDVFGPAIAAAGNKNLPGYTDVIAERNKASVRTFFKMLEDENISALIDLFAEDGEQINPYNGGVFPAGAKGRVALLNYWAPVPGNFAGMQFPIKELLSTEDPNIIFVRYEGRLKLKDGAGTYENTYYSTFRFDQKGKITEYVEVFDPILAARSFGLIDQLK